MSRGGCSQLESKRYVRDWQPRFPVLWWN
eukprot:gene26899-biopygen17481